MPPVDGSAQLIEYLFEIGPTMAGGMGAVPITFGEIHAWQQLTGTKLSPDDARTLRRLSREYLNEQQKNSAEAPWKQPDGEVAAIDTKHAIRDLANL